MNSRLASESGADIEAPLEVLVRRVDLGAVKKRDGGHRQDDHRQRQTEVELHERSPVRVGLAVVPTMVTALICVAITDRPTAHHGSDRLPRK